MRQTLFVFILFLSLLSVATVCRAQSSDVSLPTPVFSNEIAGTILPRDIGDARRTRHFYTFKGGEGDLIVIIESVDLTGDVDVFTATTLRPLLKFTLFGGSATKASKSVYLRKEELLVLRVEARADGDTGGTYRIVFGGSYAPAPADLARASEPNAPPVSDTQQEGGNVRRVTSTGARIDRPVTEVSPTNTANEVTNKKDEEATESTRAGERLPKKDTSPRTRANRNSRGSAAKTKNRGVKPPSSEHTVSDETTKNGAPAAPGSNHAEDSVPVRTPAPATPRTARSSRTRGARQPHKSAPAPVLNESVSNAPQAIPGQHFVLITKSGDIIEREMTLVRRITIENNQVVVLLTDGKVIRQPLANVLRMSIEPR